MSSRLSVTQRLSFANNTLQFFPLVGHHLLRQWLGEGWAGNEAGDDLQKVEETGQETQVGGVAAVIEGFEAHLVDLKHLIQFSFGATLVYGVGMTSIHVVPESMVEPGGQGALRIVEVQHLCAGLQLAIGLSMLEGET